MKKAMIVMASLVVLSIGYAFNTHFFNPTTPITKEPVSSINEEDTYKPLAECKDEKLQNALNQVLNQNPHWRNLIREKKLAVSLVDLRDHEQAKFAQINGKEMMYAASLPKIAILLAAIDAIDKGELKETPAVKNDMKLMIAKSNNQASTRMIDRVGYDKIADILTDPDYALYDKSRGGGLWVGKRYAAGGKRNPDPMKGLSHAATTEQIARFYYLMSKGQLISKERSAQMMEIMADPLLHHKFVNTLDKVAPSARLYRKSGSYKNFHSDSVMVLGKPNKRYILAALTEDPLGEQIMRNLVYAVEKVLQNTAKNTYLAQK
jgi:beta-lactamase class A